MILEKCAEVFYSAYRTLKFLKTVSLPGVLVFGNLCYISASVGASCQVELWLPTPCSPSVLCILRCCARREVAG